MSAMNLEAYEVVDIRQALSLGGKFPITSLAGVDGLVTVMKSGDAGRTFFRGGVDRLKKDFKPQLFVLLCHLR